jgi:DNA-binding SARP family transcriptional activator/tetratricopeptide (TPR) repeat protein
VEFLLLGPVQVFDGPRRVALGGAQAAKALVALVLADGRVVPAPALVEVLWDGEPPASAGHQVHKLIAGLRRRLPGLIETDGPGYRARLDGSTLDVARFGDLAGARTVGSLQAALELWRGPALAGVDSRALRAAAVGLEEQRLAAVEALAELRLAAGDAAAVAAELPALVTEHPLRESLRRQLMVALYRSGRQAEALNVYAQTRTLFAEELGLDPGPQLVRLQQQMLRADPALELPVGTTAVARHAPNTLPYDLPDFAGRQGDLDRLVGAAGAVVISAVDGMAGIGKTALAVHAAHRLAERYPDGQLFCDLHAHTPGALPLTPELALERLLRMAGVPPQAVPEGLDERAALWRAELAGRRVLVVLDNAATAAQVRPLLPGSRSCLVVITSRRRLGMLEGASVLSLDVLPPAEARELFAAVVGHARVAAEPDAASEVLELCGHLPLAIRIAATRLAHRPQWTVAQLAKRLRPAGRLGELCVGDRGVAAAFGVSYGQLPADQQWMFRVLGLHPGADFDALAAATLAGTDPRAAEQALEALVDAHLLRATAAGRYTFHDLLREYAHGLAPAGGEHLRRLYDYYLAATAAATELIVRDGRRFVPELRHPPAHLPEPADLDGALGWLSAEHATLVAVTGAVHDWQLPYVLRSFFELRGHYADWRATHERALAHADGPGAALLRFNLGAQAMWTGRLSEGMEHFRGVLAGEPADRHLVAAALTSLGMVAHLLHRDVEAAGYLRRALAIEHGQSRTTALGWNNLALTEGRLDRAGAAMEHHRHALAVARRAGSTSAERAILLGLGETSLRLGKPAAEAFRQALALAREGRFRMQEALALDGLAHATGDRAYWHAALAILTDLGVPQADLVRRHLAEPGHRCCDLCRAVSTVDTVGTARAGLATA